MCKINLKTNIKDQVAECIRKNNIGLSLTNEKLYICNSECFKKIETLNNILFYNKIIENLSQIRKNECIINISITTAPEKTDKPEKTNKPKKTNKTVQQQQ